VSRAAAARLLVGVLAATSLAGACGDTPAGPPSGPADQHAKAACRALFDYGALYAGVDPTDDSEGADERLAQTNAKAATLLEQAVTESAAAAAGDDAYATFAKGIDARQAAAQDTESGRELEAQTADRAVIAPTCARLGVRPTGS
jgi:hypothetical protein